MIMCLKYLALYGQVACCNMGRGLDINRSLLARSHFLIKDKLLSWPSTFNCIPVMSMSSTTVPSG